MPVGPSVASLESLDKEHRRHIQSHRPGVGGIQSRSGR